MATEPLVPADRPKLSMMPPERDMLEVHGLFIEAGRVAVFPARHGGVSRSLARVTSVSLLARLPEPTP